MSIWYEVDDVMVCRSDVRSGMSGKAVYDTLD